MAEKKQRSGQMRPSGKNTVIFVLIILLLIVLAVLLALAGQSLQNSYDALRAAQNAPASPAPTSTPTPAPSPSSPPSASATVTPKPEEPIRQIDFVSLLAENEDTVCWLHVPGTSVDYPVVYDSFAATSDHYYLTRGFDKQPDKNGTIYLAPENDPMLTERHIVIYGHNMQDGSMFASLHQFEDAGFFEENRLVYLYTPEGRRTFEIVAAYSTDDRNLHYKANYTDNAYYEAFLETVTVGGQSAGGNGSGVSLTTDDVLLTLSTCVESQKQQRYLVQAVLLEEGVPAGRE